MAHRPRQYAVQKPKGSQWETLALTEDLRKGRAEFEDAVRHFGRGYVRLVQVDFDGNGPLADYDWHVIELHDPFKGPGTPRRAGNVVSLDSARAKARKKGGARPPDGGDSQAPVPYLTYVAALLFGAAAVVVWALLYRF
jgi:hypothetical protein